MYGSSYYSTIRSIKRSLICFLLLNCLGAETFQGKVIHAKEYRDYKGFEGKNVFIVGIGNSSLDIAVELAKIAKNVII